MHNKASMGHVYMIGDMRVISEAHLIGAAIGNFMAVILTVPGCLESSMFSCRSGAISK
jgi:hypothetical protein